MTKHRTAPASGVRLSATHTRWVYAAFAALWLSGTLWLLFHHLVVQQTEFGAQPHPLEGWWLSLHGGAAMVSLVVIGTLLPVHVRRSWSADRNRRSGALLLAVAAALGATGYGLYYTGSDELRGWLSTLHWVVGLLGAPLLIAHGVLGRRSLQRRRRSAEPQERPLALVPPARSARGPSAD